MIFYSLIFKELRIFSLNQLTAPVYILQYRDLNVKAEIMIADEGARGKGFGRQAITLMLRYFYHIIFKKPFSHSKIFLFQKFFFSFSRYGIEYLNLEELSAKIKFGNLASENLFKSLGFQEVSRSEVFQETTFLLRVSQDTRTLVQAIDCTLQDFINPEE